MTLETNTLSRHSNAYNFFILILTVISLVIMVLMFMPFDDSTIGLLQFYDNLICIIFLIDFFLNLRASPKKSDYFIKNRGWLDLLGSIPSLGVTFKYSGLFRLARLSRLARITRLLRGENKKQLVDDALRNRGQYTAFITILMTIIVLSAASVLVLQFEGQSPELEYQVGLGCLLVFCGDNYHGRLRRSLSGNRVRQNHGDVHHVYGGWDNRCPRQFTIKHPDQFTVCSS